VSLNKAMVSRSVGFVKRSRQSIVHHHQQNTIHSISNRYYREKTAERTGARCDKHIPK
jgi:hypothetical protein